MKLRRNKANRFIDISMTRMPRKVGHEWRACVSVGFTNEIRSERSEDQFVRPFFATCGFEKQDLDFDRSERGIKTRTPCDEPEK